MKHHLEPERNPKIPSRFSEKARVPQENSRVRLPNRTKTEKPNLSSAGRNCKTTREVQNAHPFPSPNCQMKWMDGKGTEDELVMYMSNLPNYLERGKKTQEKVLSVGVLDWGRLEKWQDIHKVAPHRYSSYSPSSSNTSSSFSVDGSTTDSSRGHSCSPSRQTTRRSLQYHLMASPLRDHSPVVKASVDCETKLEDIQCAESNVLNQHENVSKPRMSFLTSYPSNKLKQGKGRELDLVSRTECKTSFDQMNKKEDSNPKTQVVNKKGLSEKMTDKSEQQHLHLACPDTPERPEIVSATINPGACHLSDTRPILGLRSEETSQKSIPDRFKNICHAKLTSDIPHSCPLPQVADSSTYSRVKQQSFVNIEGIKRSSAAAHSELRSGNVGNCAPRVRNPQEAPSKSKASEVSKDLYSKTSKAPVERPRSASPLRRLSVGNVGKSSSKDDQAVPPSISTSKSAKSCSRNGMLSVHSDNSSCSRPSSAAKARSSPLRRLLDPLLKPKVSQCHHVPEPLQKGLTTKSGPCQSSHTQVGSSSIKTMKTKLDSSGCKATSVHDSCQEKKNNLTAIQAVLRVDIKNGLPLITFTADNDSNIFVATKKNMGSSDKDRCSWLYTIFAVQEAKKKNRSWINQGGKGKGHDYISNPVALMNVYDAHFSNSTKDDSPSQFSIRQFVLFSMDLRQAHQNISDFQPNDEVAAIIMRIPENSLKNSSGFGSPDASLYPGDGESLQKVLFPNSQDPISATVILPSGIHSLPSRGIPSSLIDRWKSGGSCDCGGWDLGCKLTVLSNQIQPSKKLTISEACSVASKFEFFSQGGQQHEPVFSLALFKNGAFSVEFNASLSQLQAFSICIAILDGRKLLESPEWDEKAVGETISVQSNGTTTPTQPEDEIPGRYVSYPPLSPVGRV